MKELFRRLFATDRKRAHAVIAGKGAQAGITGLRRPDGALATSQQELASLAHRFFSEQAAAPSGPSGPQEPPWQDPGFDTFAPAAEPLEPAAQVPSFEDMIADRSRFMKIVHRLANGKAPGPDEVPNEVLKYMSEEMLECLHLWIQVIFKTAETPACMKESTTLLLHKKGDAALLSNYRPICLINTLGKLYTALLADCMQDFCDQFGILSASQEGFRRGKSTSRQLQLVVNALTDAKESNHDVYALFVDFSSAFNTVYHDKLFSVLRQLGFPENCIAAVASLYRGSTTKVRLAGTSTEAIPIQRGTLHGDSLSPLLFILAIEPLMRWLHAGGRCYALGCTGRELKVAAAAYADDLLALAASAEDLTVQAQKIQRYSDWVGLRPNVSKCAVSAALYGYANDCSMTNPYNDGLVRMASDRLQGLKLAGATPPFLHPHRDTYRYLGVDLTLSLDWRHDMQRAVTIAREKGDQVLASYASPRQVLQYIQSAIRPCLTYACAIGVFTHADIRRLDAALCRIARSAYRLPKSTQTALLLRQRDNAGMGLQSLLVDYVQILASSLTQALNDPGPLGVSTRALLAQQLAKVGGQQTSGPELDRLGNRVARELRPLHIAWQLGFLHQHGVTLQGPAGYDMEVTNDLLSAFQRQDSPAGPAEPTQEVSKKMTLYLAELVGCCFGDRPLKPKSLDAAVARVDGLLIMQPITKLGLLSGGRATAKHKRAYNNRLTMLLNTRTVPTSQRVTSLPEEERVVMEEELLAQFCERELLDSEESEEADTLHAPLQPYAPPGLATPAGKYGTNLHDLFEREQKAHALKQSAGGSQPANQAPAKKSLKRERPETQPTRRSERQAKMVRIDYDQWKEEPKIFKPKVAPPPVAPVQEPFTSLP